jgi:lipopolysaccharide export system protein LptA
VTPAAALTTAGLVSIESDLQQADNGTGVITASGNVRIVYPDRRVVATARQAQYFSREARIVLSGDVDVIQDDGNALRAERVIVLLNSQRVVAQPRQGQQVVSTLRLDPTGVGPGQP